MNILYRALIKPDILYGTLNYIKLKLKKMVFILLIIFFSPVTDNAN